MFDMSQWLQEKCWKEARELVKESKGVAILPVGSVEQHGYHMPLGTDSYVAITLAEEAADTIFALPMHPYLSGEQIDKTATVIRSVVSH